MGRATEGGHGSAAHERGPQRQDDRQHPSGPMGGRITRLPEFRRQRRAAQQCAGGLLSGRSPDGNGWSVTPNTFERSLVCFTARKLIRSTWLNNRDEFEQPDATSREYRRFLADAVVWALFHGSNQTSSLGKVVYEGVTYDVPNHFFWIDPKDMVDWAGLPAPIFRQCQKAKPRFATSWLKSQSFSADVLAVLDAGMDLVLHGASKRAHAEQKFQLDRWDAGGSRCETACTARTCRSRERRR